MAEYTIMKAVEFDKLSAKFRKQYIDEVDLQAAGWWLQRKYDGCFGAVDTTARTMSSRTAEPVQSCFHIVADCLHAFGAGYVVLGEVWHPTFKFPTISGHFRRHSPAPDLVFVVNDVLTNAEFEAGYSSRPYSERFEQFEKAVARYCSPQLLTAVTYCSYAEPACSAVIRAAEWQAAGGYDGAILRDPTSAWTRGTVKNGELVKVKPTLSLDLKVVGFMLKPGAKTGRGVVTLDVDYKGVITTVGSGVPHDLKGETTVGSIIEVECLGITEDGKLREPRFKGVRFDKLQPDA